MSTPTDRTLPPKKDVAETLLAAASLFIHLDPRRPGVKVPPWLSKQPQLVLEVGLNMAVRIPDLTVDDEGISCTLSFNRSPFWCSLPWSSIYALVGRDGRGMMWPTDVPAEVAAQAEPERPRPQVVPPPEPAEAGAKKPRARRAKKGDAAASGEDAAAGAAPAKPARKPRVIPVAVPIPAPEGSAPKPARPAGGAAKPKRELPPYLRVVK